MNREDIIHMAREAGLHLATDVNWMPIVGIEYAEKLIALARADERAKLQGEIETLYAMYELASKQRDYLMEQQNAQVAAMRGKMQ
jgi:hypothetical protein